LLDSGQEGGLRTLRLHLGAGREGNKGVAVIL
jgi:hypothetical protein